ncbi:MAG: hypothetical protein IK088_08210 [Lachnospiraceae bacterium]|nr:hypothetical protein [Lachnospiraceae bacterium]
MSKAKKFFCILFCVLFFVETLAIAFLILYHCERPLIDSIESIERITFCIGSKDEVEIAEKDVVKMRSSIVKSEHYGACLTKQRNTIGETLHFHMKDGEKRTIVFEGTVKILGFDVGVLNIDGREYFCDKWLVRHFKYLLEDYRRK